MPAVHFGLMASGDTVMKSGEDRDDIARQEDIVGFEMEGAEVWDTFPCVVIKGARDYADSHKTKAWQRYAAATAAAYMKAFRTLGAFVVFRARCDILLRGKKGLSQSLLTSSGLHPGPEQATGPWCRQIPC